MSKEIYISSTPHETRLAIVENDTLTEIYYERENEYTLAGSIYNGRVTRVLPGMQSSFVDIGLERDAFLYITDFMEEAPDSAEFDTSSNGDHAPRAPRTLEGERGGEPAAKAEGGRGPERGGRGRRGGRNGHDRGGERDRADAPRTDAPRGDAPQPSASEAAAPVAHSESAEVGEGAPGADGSRRWRGRRGRRRGRGGNPAQAGDGIVPAAAEVEPEFEGEVLLEGGAPLEDESGYEIDGAADQASAAQPSHNPTSPRNGSGRNEGLRSEGQRGGRGDGRGDRQKREGQRLDGPRRDSAERSDRRPDRPQRVPRGFSPSRDLYGVEGGEASSTGPIANAYPDADQTAAEPIILPGESLSKYRKGDPEPSAQTSAAADAVTVTLAPPANLYTVAEGWDGGAVLPGESLSRRRPAETRSEQKFEGRRDKRREGRADLRNPQPQQPAVSNLAIAAVSAPEIREEQAAPVAKQLDTVMQDAGEYEPSEASASYRVDPLPRSEYRQSAPVLEPPVEQLEEPAQPLPTQEVETSSAAEVAAYAHDITAISATGEMFSEPVDLVPEATLHTAPMEVPEPASPIHHEGAVLSGERAIDLPGGFAPGSGPVDEEVMDEEVVDDEEPGVTTLHASSIEEMDYEEEALEGAADLGTMLREMSIDNITRTSPDAGDDFEEDDLEEDDLEEDDEEAHEGYEIDDNADLDESESEEADNEIEEETARSGSADFGSYSGDREFLGQSGADGAGQSKQEHSGAAVAPRDSGRDAARRGGRRDGRRGRGDRERGGDRARSTGGSGDRERSGRPGGNGRGRHSAQATNLPAISDLLKPGQEILVQIAKEPIAKKGARITSHIALPGRFLVFMPTVNHTGVSRKIESDGERRRLKEILLSEKGEASGGFIVRTAAEGASEEELRSDLRFLLNLWTDIKARSESSKSPALIYHDLNLIERILRDQVTDNFSAIWVDTDTEYERVLRFLQRFQPSLIRRVKLYLKETPLFEQFGITEEINKALRSKVWLKSGGSIVINQTEALVAIDINTGKFVGKTARLEDTIVKTNLDAIPEIVRQIRLRDLGGIIIIDFIDMDERKNRNKVMAALEEELKSDRAPSKVLQFNDFGLVAITRKRVKQSLERTLSTTCNVCVGTGMVKSPITVCNDIYVEMRKMHKHLDRGDVMLRVHPEVVKQLKTSGSKWLQEMEEMCGKTILVKSDPSLHPEQFDIH